MTNAIAYLSFKINQDEIAKTLCVLRAQANNSCNGNCVLNAKIKELNDLEKKQTSSNTEKQEIVYVFLNQDFTLNKPQFFIENEIAHFTLVKNPKAISLFALRPPIV